MSVNAACKEVQRESDGIPAETIRRWWQEIKAKTAEELVKDDQLSTTACNPSETQDNQEYQGHGRGGLGIQKLVGFHKGCIRVQAYTSWQLPGNHLSGRLYFFAKIINQTY
jgi:hypothetical protein